MRYAKRLLWAILPVIALGIAGFYVQKYYSHEPEKETFLHDGPLTEVFRQQVNSKVLTFDEKAYDDRRQAHTLRELSAGGPIVVLRLSQMVCPCIDKELKDMEILSAVIGREKVAIVTGFCDTLDFRTFRDGNKIYAPLYNVPCDSARPVDMRLIQNAHLYVLDKSLKPFLVFFPDSHHPEWTEEYFTEVKRYFGKEGPGSRNRK